ncbi:MAG: YCF48-related protein, partial [Bradymonadaceae bacterium]
MNAKRTSTSLTSSGIGLAAACLLFTASAGCGSLIGDGSPGDDGENPTTVDTSTSDDGDGDGDGDGNGDGDNTTTVDTSTTGGDDGNGDGDGSSSGVSGWEYVGAPAQQVDVESVRFHDKKHGWLTTTGPPMVDERGVWYTDNGGKSWDLRREQFNAYDARFDATGERVWMGGSNSRELWYSDDNKDFKPKDGAIEPQDLVGELYFWNKNEGILGSETAGRIHRTTDGGDSFKLHEFGKKDAGINDFEVLGDEVWASTGVDFQGDGTGGRILHSEDRGKTWDLHKLTDKAHHYKGGSIQAVHAISSDEVWAAGVNRQLYHTTDGMESWEQIEGVPADAYGFNDIEGVGDHLIAGGNHDEGIFIYESTDGGETWEMTYV